MGYTTKNLREYRMEQGLSMSELSYKAKITASQISLLEKQKIKKPQVPKICKLLTNQTPKGIYTYIIS